MGCAVSTLKENSAVPFVVKPLLTAKRITSTDKDRKQSRPSLTAEIQKMVQHSWYRLVEHRKLDQLGVPVFLEIFQLAPAAKELFHYSDKATTKELEADRRLRQHATRFMSAIGAVVDNLNKKNGNDLDAMLRKMGADHTNLRSFNQVYFVIFKEALLSVLERTIGRARFRGELKGAWRSLITYMMEVMREGYDLQLDVLADQTMHPSGSSPETDAAAPQPRTGDATTRRGDEEGS